MKYVISEAQLKSLIEDSLTLTALEVGGVDNWSWYGDSICMFLEEAGVEDFNELVDLEMQNFQRLFK